MVGIFILRYVFYKHNILHAVLAIGMIFLVELPSPNHRTVSAVPVDRRGVIRLSWTALTVPSGELPITGYSIRYKVQNGTSFKYTSVTSNSVAAMITDLNPGTVYRVYVAGASAIRGSPYCCEGTPVLVRTYNGKLHYEQVLHNMLNDFLCLI